MLIKRIDGNNHINPINNPAIIFNGVKVRGIFKNNYGYGYDYVYGNKQREKKVAVSFTKRNIENFCPLNCIKIQSFRRSKTLQELPFKSYLFVNITEKE